MANATLCQIVYPSKPPVPGTPTLGYVSGGTLSATTYFVKTTYVTVFGESLTSAENSIAVPANNVLTVTSPAQPSLSYATTGWSAYVSTETGTETLQATTAIGTTWTEPTSGLIAGVTPPSTWGTSFIPTYPVRQQPRSKAKVIGQFTRSTIGLQQSLVQYVDQEFSFQAPFIALGTDANNWKAFLDQAVAAVPFDFYPDSTQSAFTTYLMTDTDYEMAYVAMALYSTTINCRVVIL